MTTPTPEPDQTHDVPLTADDLPATEAVEAADAAKRVGEDPEEVRNATAPGGEPNPDLPQAE
jgi:hypothetical protein